MIEFKEPTMAELENIKSVVNFFQTYRQGKGNTLFDVDEPKYFWRISDLSLKYPNVFNPNAPFSTTYIFNFNRLARQINKNPFKALDYVPVHFETIRETYNIRDSQGRIKTKNANNQHISIVAMEHVFNKNAGYYIEQAYCLSPNASLKELYTQSEEIKLAHARQKISNTMKALSSLINRCSNKKGPDPYALIIGNFWNTMYKAQNSQDLHVANNIKNSLSVLDYMHANTLNYINDIFQKVINKFETDDPTFDKIMYALESAAISARYFFETRGKKPEDCLFHTETVQTINTVNKKRKNFIIAQYPKSLQQR